MSPVGWQEEYFTFMIRRSRRLRLRRCSGILSSMIKHRQVGRSWPSRLTDIWWLVALFPLVFPAAVEAQYTYTTNSPNTNTITITGYSGPGGAVAIPSTIGGKFVTRIGENAFLHCESLISVTIPNTVTDISTWAFFSCDNLVSASIPYSVTSIGESAF